MNEGPPVGDAKRRAAATGRNREPILGVLARVLPATGVVLEVASGTGEHAVYFARALPGVVWQPSDVDAGNCASIAAWRAEAGLDNVRAPLRLDVMDEAWPGAAGRAGALGNINMDHIAPWGVC